MGSPLKSKLMSMYLPKRLELWLRLVRALPKASSTHVDLSSTSLTLCGAEGLGDRAQASSGDCPCPASLPQASHGTGWGLAGKATCLGYAWVWQDGRLRSWVCCRLQGAAGAAHSVLRLLRRVGQPRVPPNPTSPLPTGRARALTQEAVPTGAPLVTAGKQLVRRRTGGPRSGFRPFLTILPASPLCGISQKGHSPCLLALCTLPLPCSLWRHPPSPVAPGPASAGWTGSGRVTSRRALRTWPEACWLRSLSSPGLRPRAGPAPALPALTCPPRPFGWGWSRLQCTA